MSRFAIDNIEYIYKQEHMGNINSAPGVSTSVILVFLLCE